MTNIQKRGSVCDSMSIPNEEYWSGLTPEELENHFKDLPFEFIVALTGALVKRIDVEAECPQHQGRRSALAAASGGLVMVKEWLHQHSSR